MTVKGSPRKSPLAPLDSRVGSLSVARCVGSTAASTAQIEGPGVLWSQTQFGSAPAGVRRESGILRQALSMVRSRCT